MKQPLLSVIIPTFTVEKYLRECLDSVVNQTYKNLEIIILDDASKDKTPSIIQEYKKDDKRIKTIYNKKNIGPGKSRNKGIELATGEYITFVDHDDIQDLTKYEKMINRAIKTKSDIVFCSALEFTENSKKMDYTLYKIPNYLKNQESKDISNFSNKAALFKTYTPPWLKIINLKLIKNNKIKFSENDNKFDDVLYHYCTIICANKISFIDEVLYKHRFFDSSISGQAEKNSDMYYDLFKTWNDLEKFCNTQKINVQKVLSFYIESLSFCIYKVNNSCTFVNKIKKIIKEHNLKKNNCYKLYKKSYSKIMNYSKLKKFWYKTRQKILIIRFKPKKKHYELVIFGIRIV